MLHKQDDLRFSSPALTRKTWVSVAECTGNLSAVRETAGSGKQLSKTPTMHSRPAQALTCTRMQHANTWPVKIEKAVRLPELQPFDTCHHVSPVLSYELEDRLQEDWRDEGWCS